MSLNVPLFSIENRTLKVAPIAIGATGLHSSNAVAYKKNKKTMQLKSRYKICNGFLIF
jgi:hypothetical protein